MQPAKWAEKAPEYVAEANQLGVEINPPSVNASEVGFIIKDNHIYFGLEAIRDVGKTAARKIISARGKTNFKNMEDFVMRVDRAKINTKVFSALVKAGAFDRMGYDRRELLEKTDEIYAYPTDLIKSIERQDEILRRSTEDAEVSALIEKRNALREIDRRSRLKRNPGPELTAAERLRLEELEEMKLRKRAALKPIDPPVFPTLTRSPRINISVNQLIEQAEYIGCYLREHPARVLYPDAQAIKTIDTGEYVDISGVITRRKDITTRRGQPMSFLAISDGTGDCELICFSSTYVKLTDSDGMPAVGDIVKISGKVETVEPVTKMLMYKAEIYRS